MPTWPTPSRPRDTRPSASKRGYGARWQRWRKMVLAREPLCRTCGKPATDVDHIVPRRDGGSDAIENLQALCHSCHSRKTVGREPAVLMGRFTVPVFLVCGPPGAGKTTFVYQHKASTDIVIDTDALFMAISGRDMYDKPSAMLPHVFAARDAIVRSLCADTDVTAAWLIIGGAKKRDRQPFVDAGARVVMLAASRCECMTRIRKDTRRTCPDGWSKHVDRWWSGYEPCGDDEPQVVDVRG